SGARFGGGGRGTDPDFGHWEWGGTQPWLADARKSINRENAQKVEGTGKLTVDVNAPRGTKVDAKGGGLFKRVQMNRSMQMTPPASGARPAPRRVNSSDPQRSCARTK